MKKLIKIILVILWMSLIFCFSSQKADDSSKLSDGLIVKVANIFVDKNLSTKDKEIILERYTTIVRKTAHFTVYLILGILVISLLLEYNIKHIILVSLITCLLYRLYLLILTMILVNLYFLLLILYVLNRSYCRLKLICKYNLLFHLMI